MTGEPKANLRILALVTDAFGGGGGIAQYNRDLLRALVDSGLARRVVVLTRTLPSGAVDSPAAIEQFSAPASRVAYVVRAMFHAFRNGHFDVVFCGHLHLVPLAWFVAKISRASLWVQLHGIECWERPGFFRQWTVERSKLITAVSRYTRRRFLRWARMEQWRVRVLPNTVDGRFQPGPKREAIVARFGLEGKTVLLTVGRLDSRERYKGHDRVMKALCYLKTGSRDYVYLIAGDGHDRFRLENMARELEMEERIRFLGQVADADLPDIFRAADIYIMPSTAEGFGIAYLEALASGNRVVALACCGAVDALRDGANGTLLPPDVDPVVLARTIDEAALAITGSVKPTVQEVFGRDRFVRHLVNVVSTAKLELMVTG